MAALERICASLPAPWVVWIHQIHTPRGVGSSITMVVVFGMCLYVLCVAL
jgi:hypothetical protein